MEEAKLPRMAGAPGQPAAIAEMLYKIALKAQAQCRVTWEAADRFRDTVVEGQAQALDACRESELFNPPGPTA